MLITGLFLTVIGVLLLVLSIRRRPAAVAGPPYPGAFVPPPRPPGAPEAWTPPTAPDRSTTAGDGPAR